MEGRQIWDQYVETGHRMTVTVAGLGAVGLHLAIRLADAGHEVITYEDNSDKVETAQSVQDATGEIGDRRVSASAVHYTSDEGMIKNSDFITITVFVRIDGGQSPPHEDLEEAAQTVGRNLTEETIVVLKSTFVPGAIREILGPAIKDASGLTVSKDLSLAYSPEELAPDRTDGAGENRPEVVRRVDDETIHD